MKKGFSLALTLWIVAILSLLSAYYLSYGKKIVKKSRELQIKLDVLLEAESMLELIKFYGATGIVIENKITNIIIQEKFKNFPNTFFIDSRKMVWGNSTILLQDTAGLIDINDQVAIADYVAEDKEKKAIIKESISDWYDYDDFSSLNGAEKSFYTQDSNRRANARNEHYFAAPEELFLIRGLENQSTLQKQKLLKNIVISDGGGNYNLFTLQDTLLKSRYKLTNNDMEQLRRVKKQGLEAFKSMFYTLNKRRSTNFEQDGVNPSYIVRGKIKSSFQNITEKIEFLIDFNVKSEEKIFEVLYYKN